MNIEFVLMGFLVGGLVGLTGVGGASLLTLLLIFLGINLAIAIGTYFVYNSITKLFGTIQHVRQRTVDFQLVKYLAMGSVPGSVLANLAVFSILSSYYNKQMILTILGVILILLSILTAFQFFWTTGKTNKPEGEVVLYSRIGLYCRDHSRCNICRSREFNCVNSFLFF